MRSLGIIIIILVVFVGFWLFLKNRASGNEGPKQKPIAESNHSKAFNLSIDSAMDEYYGLTESFVNWDSNAVKQKAEVLGTTLSNFKLDELKKDSAGIEETASLFLNEVKSNLDSIKMNNSIVNQRQALNNLTQNLYDFLRTVKFDRSKLYLDLCPMAFNETEPGVWLSKTTEIRNPYLGLHHPHYGKAMIDCGEIKDTLNFIRSK